MANRSSECPLARRRMQLRLCPLVPERSVGAAATALRSNTKEPSITGSPIVGKELTGNRGNWTGRRHHATPTGGCAATRARANCAAIAGATGTHYTLSRPTSERRSASR